MSEPCVLIQEGELWKCPRHGMYHNGKMREYALGTDEKSQNVRAGWDRLIDSHKDKPLPPLHERAANYLASLADHTANGGKMVPLQVRDYRWKICEPCEYRNRKHNACSLCGCPLNPDNLLGDKLGWAVSACPMKKWEKWASNDDQVKHLLYHIWPRKTSAGTWQRNLDQLKQRWPLFNGKRFLAVATSSDSHSFESVQAYMKGYDCEFIHVENDPSLREVRTFLPLFERIEGLPGYTFYAHAKGVTKPVDPGVSIHHWTAAMYELLLDYWPVALEMLGNYPVVGVFKKQLNGAFGNSSCSTWHYSGSFCWYNNAELWKRNWRNIEQAWFGIESYPSMVFSREESGCLFWCKDKQFDLYEMYQWNRVQTELEHWRRQHAGRRVKA